MQESTDGVDVVLTRGETELRALERWWRIFWWVHCWLTVSSVICSIVVLALGALMIYLPTDQQLKINIIMVVLATLSLALQLTPIVARFRERANRGRRMAADLKNALGTFRAGLMPLSVLNDTITIILKTGADEEGP